MNFSGSFSRFLQEFGDGSNTVSESTVSNYTELSKFLGQPIIVCESELTEFFVELSELGAEVSESSLSNQHSQTSIPPVS